MVNIAVLEAGVIFHSLLIGLTLVVAGDSTFITLFVVILFHQIRCRPPSQRNSAPPRTIPTYIPTRTTIPPLQHPTSKKPSATEESDSTSQPPETCVNTHTVSMRRKLLLATAFALVTPVGMAIGIGVLKNFNGNDPSTIIAIGTLDALSAGILAWVGVVEMRAHDWMLGGEMTTALVSSFSYLPSESNASAPSRASKSEVDHEVIKGRYGYM
ncbi:hypothetical protein B0T25DRAFT_512696 [Lasiosphaeria hispida]|uniref:Zinc/iron permease n=1 Tax=Lasiosphaeria hispida TaxID=260671 RepID=A0AAJ0MJ81_9PEZI|nr:hypothetical protein B0T25DRAFT_512696 [Lasiosphaeria hispida]